ncbi:MAG: polysaccharide biosynthesis protein [Gammaproteobacteria bacterium]|nr:polysaccharide biosynthesis protein [Gammaproteobacteria bacterium]
MKDIFSYFIEAIINQRRWKKTAILMIADYILLVISFFSSLSIRINDWFIPQTAESILVIFVIPIIAIPIFYICGLYQSFTRYTGIHSLRLIIMGISIYTTLWFLIVLLPSLIIKPYDFLIINFLLTIFFIGGIRLLARPILRMRSPDSDVRNVLIYGAGSSGRRLASAIQTDMSIKIKGFIDDDIQKQGLFIEGKRIYPRKKLEKLIQKKYISEILIAMPSVPKSELGEILEFLKKFSIMLRKIPDIIDLTKGNITFSDLRRIRIEDLLHREVRAPNKELLSRDIEGRSILVTGAGGSIGSELCREIIKLSPKRIILFEINEYALYEIERELKSIGNEEKILAVLGDINHKDQLLSIMKNYHVETVFHTAAYKHVPMVEKNSLSAIRTNILGTMNTVTAALNSRVSNFVFISTDKAVRPTNIMGASKRFAELLLQAIIKRERHNGSRLRVSMVRFGNVLGSSGSVVPLFRKQIEDGGPLTVTDPEIIRYFMTINEAAQLVIQSGAMGQDGEVFLLDMGDPIKIVELAKDMIRLSGMTVRDKENKDGDIEIKFTGLRPGEKLFEELLIDHKSIKTPHKKIMIAQDKTIEWDEIKSNLAHLEHAIKNEDYILVNKVFTEIVEDFG